MNPKKQFSIASSPMDFKLDKDEIRKTGRFVAFFMLAYLFISVAFYAAIPEQNTQQFIAGITASVFNGELSQAENPLVTMANGTVIEISPLCTGMTELFIVISAILASIGISKRKRLMGAAAAAVIVFGLNIFRIFVTLSLILNNTDLGTIELAHNILFRIFLFISIAAIYIAWFYWAATGQPKQNV